MKEDKKARNLKAVKKYQKKVKRVTFTLNKPQLMKVIKLAQDSGYDTLNQYAKDAAISGKGKYIKRSKKYLLNPYLENIRKDLSKQGQALNELTIEINALAKQGKMDEVIKRFDKLDKNMKSTSKIIHMIVKPNDDY